jgi:hypothetical protein
LLSGSRRRFNNSNDFAMIRHGTEHLAHQVGRRRVLHEGARAVGRDDLDALTLQHPVTRLLHDQVAGEKRLAVSTMNVRTPLLAMRSSKATKPVRVSIGSAPLTAASQ